MSDGIIVTGTATGQPAEPHNVHGEYYNFKFVPNIHK